MAKAAGLLARTFTSSGRKRHARMQMASNRKAQDQTLFGFDRKTTDLWNRKSRSMTQDEAMGAFDMANSQGKAIGQRTGEVKRQLANGQGLSKTGRTQLQNELKSLQDAGSNIGKDRGIARSVMDGTGSHKVNMPGMEQAMSKGKAAAHYMWGGTRKQIAARNGAAAAGIIGVGVGLDALDGSIRD